jgi:hypothetical protein
LQLRLQRRIRFQMTTGPGAGPRAARGAGMAPLRCASASSFM